MKAFLRGYGFDLVLTAIYAWFAIALYTHGERGLGLLFGALGLVKIGFVIALWRRGIV